MGFRDGQGRTLQAVGVSRVGFRVLAGKLQERSIDGLRWPPYFGRALMCIGVLRSVGASARHFGLGIRSGKTKLTSGDIAVEQVTGRVLPRGARTRRDVSGTGSLLTPFSTPLSAPL